MPDTIKGNSRLMRAKQAPRPSEPFPARTPVEHLTHRTHKSHLMHKSHSSHRKPIWCQSSREFDRLRPFSVIHRVFAVQFPFFRGVRVRSSSFEFVSVRSTSNLVCPPRRAGQPKRQKVDEEKVVSRPVQETYSMTRCIYFQLSTLNSLGASPPRWILIGLNASGREASTATAIQTMNRPRISPHFLPTSGAIRFQ